MFFEMNRSLRVHMLYLRKRASEYFYIRNVAGQRQYEIKYCMAHGKPAEMFRFQQEDPFSFLSLVPGRIKVVTVVNEYFFWLAADARFVFRKDCFQ